MVRPIEKEKIKQYSAAIGLSQYYNLIIGLYFIQKKSQLK
ncbi:protein of unknown function [Legionella fallonii LLAP-10]|uniref:Uncharacterized protein n=1 Tax=Legionella fallonii LLAP-10 TaxID=1212491 RepID=A0A098GAP1_9GAMM|nr:protein of unknown function [Legionella fallonii LLAP-10]